MNSTAGLEMTMFAAKEKAASLLGLAAAPAFMPVNDMALMYLLMSLFHVSPWLKLFPAHSRHRNTSVTQTEGD